MLQPHLQIDFTVCGRGPACLLTNVHSRLREAHIHWHSALDHYADPSGFVAYLNPLIQALRNVTFALQSSKSELSGFESWYTEWQEHLKSDPIMIWCKDARNTIVKQADIETSSIARVAVVTSYTEPPFIELDVPPLMPAEAIASFVVDQADLSEVDSGEALLRVERRWVAIDLPKHELLDAMAHAFTTLIDLTDDAHDHFGLASKLKLARKSKRSNTTPQCMIAADECRTTWMHLATKNTFHIETTELPDDERLAAISKSIYGDLEYRFRDITKASNDKELSIRAFELARLVFLRSGFHMPMALLLMRDGGIQPTGFDPNCSLVELATWRVLANNVKKEDARAVIFMGQIENEPIKTAKPDGDLSDREFRTLSLFYSSEDGTEYGFAAKITSTSDTISLADTVELKNARFNMFRPIRENWAKQKTKQRSFKQKHKRSR